MSYLHYYTALSKFVQFAEDRVRLLDSPASYLAPRNQCEGKREKFIKLTSNRLPTSVLTHAGTVSNFEKPAKAYFYIWVNEQ